MTVDRDLEELMSHLGEYGTYQRRQVILLVLAALTGGIHMVSLVTVAAVPDHRCLLPGENPKNPWPWNSTEVLAGIPLNKEGKLDSCKMFAHNGKDEIKCDAWVYDLTYYKSSRAIEWDFVCDRRWMGAVSQTAYMIGVFTGAATLGRLADKIGRKKVFYIAAVFQLIFGVSVAFVNEFYTFLALRYMYGIFGSAGAYIAGFVSSMELVGVSKRTSTGVAFSAAFGGGIMVVAFWGWIIKDRFWLQVIYGLHSLMLIGHWWLIDESISWLWSQGRIEEAVAIVQKAVKVNTGKELVDVEKYLKRKKIEEEEKEDAGIWGLLRTPNLRKNTLNICLNWFANSLGYYGFSLTTGALPGNPFLMLFVVGLVEYPSYVLVIMIMDKVGRRSFISTLLIVAGIACFVSALIPQTSEALNITVISVVMFGKFCIAGSFAILYNYTAELFPTVVRTTALGFGGMCARVSGAITPLLILLDSLDKILPVSIIASIVILAGLASLLLPETLNQPLPQTLEDGENLGVGDTACSGCFGKKKRDGGEPKQVIEEPTL